MARKGQQRLFPCCFAWAQLHLSTFAVQVRLHQPPAQEKRLCCKVVGETGVDVNIEMAVGAWVACDSIDQALTCHSTADALVFAVNRTACSTTSGFRVPGERVTALASTLVTWAAVNFSSDRRVATRTSRLLRSKLRFWGCLTTQDRRVDREETTFVASVSYHLADVASVALLGSKLTGQISSVGRNSLRPNFRPPLFRSGCI